MGAVVNQRLTNELPLNGRNFIQLATLSPGVNGVGFSATGTIMSGTRPDDRRPGHHAEVARSSHPTDRECGMAGFVAKKLCPQLICLPLNHKKYSAKAEEVREVFVEYDSRFESASIDEAYLNITEYCQNHDIGAEDAVQQMETAGAQHA